MAAMFAIFGLTAWLGFWQLDRAAQKLSMQAARDRAAAQAPLSLSGRTPITAADARRIESGKLQLEGAFLPERAVFLDNRTRDGVAGFEVLMPLQLTAGSQLVLVMRGWVAGNPRRRDEVPAVITPSGQVRVEGLAMAELPQPMVLGSSPVPGPADRIWQHFSFERFEQWSGRSAAPLIVRQIGEPAWNDGLNRQWNQPGSGVDKHRAYALQWFVMSALAAIFAVGYVIRTWRAERARMDQPG